MPTPNAGTGGVRNFPASRHRAAAIAAGLLVVSMVVPGGVLRGQTETQIRVGEDRLLSSGIDDRPLVEPHLAVHPEDPSRLLATAMVVAVPLPPPGQGVADEQICASWVSEDGGRSWTRHDFSVAGCADPWVAFTPEGVAVFVALGTDAMYVYRSADGGLTWDPAPLSLGDGHDHPVLIGDATGGPFDGSLYLATGRGGRNPWGQFRWTVYVARSTDAARSFPFVEQVIASNMNYEAHLPAVLSDGTLLVPFSDHHAVDGRRLDPGSRRSWLLRSQDGGQTFTEPLFITDRCDGRGGWPSLVSDHEDRLFFVCAAVESEGILVFTSEDRGESWPEGQRVDRAGRNAFTRTPSIAVDASGIVGVAWYDRRDDPDGECQHVYFTVSLDAGRTFVPDVRVSDTESCPATEANDWAADRFPMGGDYSGLVATGPGRFHLVWADSRDGIYRLRNARVSLPGATRSLPAGRFARESR